MVEERCREPRSGAVVRQGAESSDRAVGCGAGSGPITIRVIAYRGVSLGLAGKMFQGRPPQGVMSRAASVNCFFEGGSRRRLAGREEKKGGLRRVN